MMCFIFLVGSIKLITSSTQLLTPVENMTGSHSQLRQARKFYRFLRLQMLRSTQYSQNHRWKSSFLRGDIMYPSSSGVKTQARTQSSSITTVNLLGSFDGGSNLGLSLLPSMMAWGRYDLLGGLALRGDTVSVLSGFLLKKPWVRGRISPVLIIVRIRQSQLIFNYATTLISIILALSISLEICLISTLPRKLFFRGLTSQDIKNFETVVQLVCIIFYVFGKMNDAQFKLRSFSEPITLQILSLFYHQMLKGVDLEVTQPAPLIPPIVKSFKLVQQQLEVHDYFNLLQKQEVAKFTKERQITPKMRAKLLGWLQKLARQTFHFSTETLITASSIIDQYLQKKNEQPSVLQLLGCCSLFIASKLHQEIIVEPDCYATASCNVFTKRQLIQKERGMYLHIDWRRIREGSLPSLRQGLLICGIKDKLSESEQILWSCLKDEELSFWKQLKLIYGVLSLLTTEEEPSLKDSLNLIRLIQ